VQRQTASFISSHNTWMVIRCIQQHTHKTSTKNDIIKNIPLAIVSSSTACNKRPPAAQSNTASVKENIANVSSFSICHGCLCFHSTDDMILATIRQAVNLYNSHFTIIFTANKKQVMQSTASLALHVLPPSKHHYQLSR